MLLPHFIDAFQRQVQVAAQMMHVREQIVKGISFSHFQTAVKSCHGAVMLIFYM